MNSSINFDSVADIYDLYVDTNLDIAFYLNECSKVKGEVLELMCGTGRVSIPLLDNGYSLCCVDYMKNMLDVFKKKTEGKNYKVDIIQMDVSELNLNKCFDLILLPFNSFSEIIDTARQVSALNKIHGHLNEKGRFICTLHNPIKRLLSADGNLHKIGRFKKENTFLEVSYINVYDKESKLIKGEQYYEFYDNDNTLLDKRKLEINFRLYGKSEFEKMLENAGFKINQVYGNYDYSVFVENESPFMIWVLTKEI